MFFITYLRRELRRRMRQAVFIALGLALGIGLVVTVTAASAGVTKAQADVLKSLYGVGTDVTVTGKPPKAPTATSRGAPPKGATQIQVGPGGAQICQNGKCQNAAGKTIDHLTPGNYGPINQSKVAEVAGLKDVAAAAGGLVLTDTGIKIPKNFGGPGGSAPPTPSSFNVDGVDTSHLSLGPLSAGKITSGHSLTSSDANSDVAVVDSGYAISHKLKVGSKVGIVGHNFKVIGIVSQPQGGSPPDVYIPLARAQALATGGLSGKSLKNDVNAIYVTAASASDISIVQSEIKHLLPADTVTTAASLAGQVTGSLSSTAKLAHDLGKWLSILVLIAAFAVASLLTMAAVARRVREFGTLKALGWRSGRIMAQVIGESLAIGILGGAAGVGLGFAGAAIITSVAGKLTAGISTPTGQHIEQASGGGGPVTFNPTVAHTVAVPLSAPVTVGAIVAAVLLALAGGLLAGAFGSWRIAQLRPADALTRVA
jgi:putative ABC transport system permease protein